MVTYAAGEASAKDIARKFKLTPAEVLKRFKDGALPGTRVHARKIVFDVEACRKALTDTEPGVDDPHFDEADFDLENEIGRIEYEALQVAKEAILAFMIKETTKAAKGRNVALASRIMQLYAEVIKAIDADEEE